LKGFRTYKKTVKNAREVGGGEKRGKEIILFLVWNPIPGGGEKKKVAPSPKSASRTKGGGGALKN